MPFVNRYRLPFNLRRPQYQDEKEVFRKANGETVVLSSIVRKQYEGVTDYMPDKLHERLKIALSHELVAVEGEKYFGSVVQDGGYEIAYPDFLDYPLAPAKFNVNVTPYNASASNCGSCEEYSQVVTEDDDIGTIGEDETVIVPILYNDAICCSPFDISLVTFNSTYLDSCTIIGNTLQIHTKTGIPIQNDVVLATYRVTCENGMYDEANIIADVEGTVVGCLNVIDTTVDSITASTARGFWTNPGGAISFNWVYALLVSPGIAIETGSTTPADMEVFMSGLTPNTSYRFCVQSVCGEGDVGEYNCFDFTTEPAAEDEFCGQYTFTFNQSCPDPYKGSVTYLDCDDTFQIVQVFSFVPVSRCLRQTSPGVPVSWEMTATTAPAECDPYVSITYDGPC